MTRYWKATDSYGFVWGIGQSKKAALEDGKYWVEDWEKDNVGRPCDSCRKILDKVSILKVEQIDKITFERYS